jgi:hypothetical protein
VSASQLATAAVLPVALALWVRSAPRRSDLDRRRSTMRTLRRLNELVAECSSPHGLDEVTASVAGALRDALQLRECWFEPAPATDGDLPVIEPDGNVTATVQRRSGEGLVLPPRTALPVADGRFVLVGDPLVGLTPERRLIAVAMANVVGLARVHDRHP